MPVLRLTMHAGVMPADSKLRARYQRGAHLVAGDLDGACGPLAVWSALIVLGIVSRRQVICRDFACASDKFDTAWQKSVALWFDGTDEDEMVALLATVAPFIDHQECFGAMRKQIEFVVERLRRNEVVLLGLERRDERDGHWVLAVGLEELVTEKSGQVIGILCLDSSEPPPDMLRYNARLELHVPKKGATYVRYRGASGESRSMTIDRSIALLPARSSKRAAKPASVTQQRRVDSV